MNSNLELFLYEKHREHLDSSLSPCSVGGVIADCQFIHHVVSWRILTMCVRSQIQGYHEYNERMAPNKKKHFPR